MRPNAYPQLAAGRVLVVGDVMLDRYWHGQVDRISPEAPVPVVRVTQIEDRLGGCANVALNIASLGGKASLLSVVGEDDDGRRLEQLIAAQGIHAELKRDPHLQTTVKVRIIGRHQQLLRADFENEPQTEVLSSQTQRFSELVVQHQVVLCSDYGKGGLAHIPEMIAHAQRSGKPVLVDPKGADYSRYAGATLITPNRAELQQVVGKWHSEDELTQKAHALRQSLDLQAILLTRSEEGMTLFDDAGQMHVPAQAREVFDVTGAGDTVIATLAAFMSVGASLRDAVPWSNKAGGIVVGKFGTACVTPEELFA